MRRRIIRHTAELPAIIAMQCHVLNGVAAEKLSPHREELRSIYDNLRDILELLQNVDENVVEDIIPLATMLREYDPQRVANFNSDLIAVRDTLRAINNTLA